MADTVVLNKRKKWNDEAKWGLVFAMLPVVEFLLFTAGPFIFSILASFTNWNSMGDHDFVGLDNYKKLFADPRFWKSL